MENKTIAEVYKNSSDEVKQILETKFTDNELGKLYIPKYKELIAFNANPDNLDEWSFAQIDSAPRPDQSNSFFVLRCYYVIRFNGAIDYDCTTLAYKCRPITQEENNYIESALLCEGYRWDKVHLIKVKKRAQFGGLYYYITDALDISTNTELGLFTNDKHYSSGNYFLKEESAEKVIKLIKDNNINYE